VTFDNAAAASTVAHFPAAGTYTLTLTANDGSLNGTDTVDITVTPPAGAVFPAAGTAADSDRGWEVAATPEAVGLASAQLQAAQQYSDAKYPSSGAVIYKGRVAFRWAPGGANTLGAPLYDVKSTTKSMGGVTLGLALDQHLVTLDQHATDFISLSTFSKVDQPPPPAAPIPPNDTGVLSQITIQELATHTASFAKPGGYCQLLKDSGGQPVTPGTVWSYSDCGLNWLADALTNAFHDDLAHVAQVGVWQQIGIPASDIQWRNNQYRQDEATTPPPPHRELAAGIITNMNAMARVGLLFLNNGAWNGAQILPQSFVESVHTPPAVVTSAKNADDTSYPHATSAYGMLWWTNTPDAGGTSPMSGVPADAYWAWGLGDSLIVVIPSKQLVIVRAQTDSQHDILGKEGWNGDTARILPLVQPIVNSIQ